MIRSKKTILLTCLTLLLYSNSFAQLAACANVNITTIDTACGEYSWNSTVYDSSGIYYDSLITSNGCDSVLILNLTVFEDSSATHITACDSVQWNGLWYYNNTMVTTTGLTTTNTFAGTTNSCNSGKESNFWYFGDGAGIDFNSGTAVPLSNSAMYADEGCASIS